MIPFLQNVVLKDFWLKLFSFALAALIWFTIHIAIKNDISPLASLSLGPTEQIVMRDLPISILLTPQESGRFTLNHQSVDVTLQGDPAGFKNLRRRDVQVFVDLTDAASSIDTRRRIEVVTPAGLIKVKVEPQEVQFEPQPAH